MDVQAQRIIGLVLSRGLCVGLINEWRDRLKASLLLNGGYFLALNDMLIVLATLIRDVTNIRYI